MNFAWTKNVIVIIFGILTILSNSCNSVNRFANIVMVLFLFSLHFTTFLTQLVFDLVILHTKTMGPWKTRESIYWLILTLYYYSFTLKSFGIWIYLIWARRRALTGFLFTCVIEVNWKLIGRLVCFNSFKFPIQHICIKMFEIASPNRTLITQTKRTMHQATSINNMVRTRQMRNAKCTYVLGDGLMSCLCHMAENYLNCVISNRLCTQASTHGEVNFTWILYLLLLYMVCFQLYVLVIRRIVWQLVCVCNGTAQNPKWYLYEFKT